MKPVFVTKPSLPPLEALLPSLRDIWERGVLTNNGPYLIEFERRLAEYFAVPHVSAVCNGTLALSLAIEAAGVKGGEVVTTPYSFVATSHAILEKGLAPVFADIRREDLNIDPAAIEAAITPRTSAILAVHCYGNPCAVEAIELIAQRHGLAVIYDAAHCFGVTHHGQSILAWGDFSTLSFHATKAFNTFEGGAIACGTREGQRNVELLRNFGIVDEVTIDRVGGNAKMNEFCAALGLLQLDRFAGYRDAREAVSDAYRAALIQVEGIEPLPQPDETEPNFSYFPILIDGRFPLDRDRLYLRLKEHGIHSRKYFYPLLPNLPMYADLPSSQPENLPVSNWAAQRVLCLPIYPDLDAATIARIVEVIATSRA